MNGIASRGLQSRLFRKFLSRFFRNLLIYTLAYVGLFLFVWLWGNSRFWYESDLLYRPLAFVNEYAPVVAVLGWAVLLLPVLLYQWSLIARDTTLLANSIAKIATDPSAPVELPPNLEAVELLLVQVQMDIQQNQERAKEAEQRKNDLVLYLAHDLKTPLTSVLGYLALLRDEADIDPEKRQEYLSVAVTKAQRLEDLINEFFEITRFNLKGMDLEPTNFSLSRLLEQVNDEFRPLYEEKGLRAELSLQPDVEVHADAGKLERVVDNLLRNAVNYSHPGSQLWLRLTMAGGNAIIEVENEGDTIAPHKLERLFEQFYRVDSSRSAQGGAGLGLAIAREIIEMHRGKIYAESKDNRILFRVVLPARSL